MLHIACMQAVIRLWLKSKRDYYTGLALLIKTSNNQKLIDLLRKGPTEFNVSRLTEELSSIVSDKPKVSKVNPPTTVKPMPAAVHPEAKAGSPDEGPPPVNPELYKAAREKALLVYKESRNIRAELFSMTKVEPWEDVNQPYLIEARSPLALKFLELDKRASELFDIADYVRRTGRLPQQDPSPAIEEYKDLPDHMVKQTLDNLRKNYNKQKNRDKTPERVARLQKMELNIKKLSQRWASLKPA